MVLPSTAPRAAAVLLAAGRGRRVGQCKALLQVCGRPLLLWHLDALVGVFDEVVVVVGAQQAEVRSVGATHALAVRWVENISWADTDMAASLRMGVAACAAPRVLCCPCDTVPAPSDALRALRDAEGAVALGHRGAPGHPICAAQGALLRVLSAGTLRHLPVEVLEQERDLCMRNINTAAELDALVHPPAPGTPWAHSGAR